MRALLLALALVAPMLASSGVAAPDAPMPLVGARPAWLTADQEARLLAGDSVAARAPAGHANDGAIRPGAWMAGPNWCTFNFVFRHRESGALGIGTAGHCVHHVGEGVHMSVVRIDDDGSASVDPHADPGVIVDCTHLYPLWGDGWGLRCIPSLEDAGPRVHQDVVVQFMRIGEVAYRIADGVGEDFALVALDADVHHLVDPTMAYVGGPCATYEGHLSTMQENGVSWLPPRAWVVEGTAASMPVLHVGHGVVVGTGGTARAGLGDAPSPWSERVEGRDGRSIVWTGSVAGGDSGSPVRVWRGEQVDAPGAQAFMTGEGGAAGILTHRGPAAGVDLLFNGWQGVGTSIARVLEMLDHEWDVVDGRDC